MTTYSPQDGAAQEADNHAGGWNYGWFIAGIGCWFAAWGMQNVIFSWLVVGELQSSPERVGTAQSCSMLPGLALLLVAGATADRLDRRGVLITVHLAAATVSAAMAIVVGAGLLSYTTVIAYALCSGTIGAFQWPARDASLSEVAGPNLMSAVTGMTMTQFGLQAFGAFLAGSARWLGSPAALLLQSAVVLVGIFPLLKLPPLPAPNRPSSLSNTAAGEIMAGLREVWHSEGLRSPIVLVVANGVLFLGPYFVLLPLAVRDLYGGDAGDLALVYMIFPAGVILGSVALLVRGGIQRKGRALLMGLFGGGASLCVLALDLPFAGFLLTVFAWGACAAIFVNTSRTLVQQAAPPSHRARVLSVYAFGIVGSGPIGSFGAGFAADLVGPTRSCAIFGVAMLALVVLVWTFSDIRRMR